MDSVCREADAVLMSVTTAPWSTALIASGLSSDGPARHVFLQTLARAKCNMRIYCALIAHYEALIRASKVSVHE